MERSDGNYSSSMWAVSFGPVCLLQALIMHHSIITAASLSFTGSAYYSTCHVLPNSFPLRQTVRIKPTHSPTTHQWWRDVPPEQIATVSLSVTYYFLSLRSHTPSTSSRGQINHHFSVLMRPSSANFAASVFKLTLHRSWVSCRVTGGHAVSHFHRQLSLNVSAQWATVIKSCLIIFLKLE